MIYPEIPIFILAATMNSTLVVVEGDLSLERFN